MAKKKGKKKASGAKTKATTVKAEATEAKAEADPANDDPKLGEELAERALDPTKQADVEEAIGELTPEQAQMFVDKLERALKKQRLQLLGYISALVALVIGTVFALYLYGTREPGTFVGWVFLIPFGCAGALLLLFGQLSKRQ
jgi:hypothetical protein